MNSLGNVTTAGRITQAVGARGRALPAGVLLGSLGVLGFSFSLPATRVAVGSLDPWLVAFGRGAVAAVLAAVVLTLARAPRPTARQWRGLVVVAAGVVLGFPLFTSLALEGRTAAHAAVVTAVMPVSTAIWAVLRAGERPSGAFWAASLAGMAAVVAFAIVQGAGDLRRDDVLLLGAVVLVGLGYAEGGALSRELGGTRTICWALIVAVPVTAPVSVVVAAGGIHAGAAEVLAFAYVAVVTVFLAFFAWYAGLARGGVAKVGQLQLAQPILTLGWSAALLGERVTAGTIATAVAVLACVVATQRTRVAGPPAEPPGS